MLTKYYISNFKSFSELQTVKLSPITLIFGQNSSGKSSIIQSLLLIKQSIDLDKNETGRPVFRGESVDLGSFLSAVHNHDLDNVMQIGFDFEPSPISRHTYRPVNLSNDPRDRNLNFYFQAAKSEGSRSNKLSSVELCKLEIGLSGKKSGIDDEDEQILTDFILSFSVDKFHRELYYTDQKLRRDLEVFSFESEYLINQYAEFIQTKLKNNLVRRRTRRSNKSKIEYLELYKNEIPDLDSLKQFFSSVRFLKKGLLPSVNIIESSAANAAIYNIDDANFQQWRRTQFSRDSLPLIISEEFTATILNTSYLGPLRNPPSRHYDISDVVGTTVGKSGEFMPDIMALNKGKGLDKKITEWFQKFEIPYLLKSEQIGNDRTGRMMSLNLIDINSGTNVGPSDVGFGIGQLLPIIVEGLTAKKRTICVEQPEIHLHPRLQANIADFFISTSMSPGSNSNQWIIETHSETLMLRLQRRIREGILPCDNVSVLYVKSSNEKSGAEIVQLRIDEDGEFIDEWPDGFFEEGFDEIFGSE